MRDRIVVTGMGIICAIGHNKDEVLVNMRDGKTGIDKIKSFSTEKFISSLGAEVKGYDPVKYFSLDEQDQYDICTQYAIIAAKEALVDSALNLEEVNKNRVGLALGTCNAGISSLENQGKLTNLDSQMLSRYPFFQPADSVARYFEIGGPVNTINTACAASGNAIGFAREMIVNGHADLMFVGGTDSMSPTVFAGFNALKALNAELCGPYSEKYGLNLGEGSAFIILESLNSALGRGAHIYSEICGYSLSNDGYHITAPEPDGKGVSLAIEQAIKNAGISKSQIQYINTHGTGTKANDAAEIKGLRNVFGEENFSRIPISSTKSYFGHNLGAAAIIEYVTTLLSMQEGFLPPNLRIETVREGCNDAYLIKESTQEKLPDYFLCNNSAFGGHNASIVSKYWGGEDSGADFEDIQQKRVGIVGLGTVDNHGYSSGNISSFLIRKIKEECEENSSFNLKEYDASLYERRLNKITQFSIGAADLALKDSNLEIDATNGTDIGLIYGTSRGSLESTTKYLSGILEKGHEFASGIYFPDLVLNSVSGKLSKIMKLKGFSSSLSTGGNDGLMSAFYGYETIKNGIQPYCLVGAGDECSALSEEINKALSYDSNIYPISEGSAFAVFADLEKAKGQNRKIYSEIKGFGAVMKSCQEKDNPDFIFRAIDVALSNANLLATDINFVLYSAPPRKKDVEQHELVLKSVFNQKETPIFCINNIIGYRESASALTHLCLASDIIYTSQSECLYEFIEPSKQMMQFNQLEKGLVVGTSANGNCIAAIVSAIQ
ncbi:beta-ketoacyl-[acyl-carrier-protein] synthase family protein [Bacillus velezensis]|mgnify:CR=1 FL=1|uniref:beta-ketoacyl-[acyl-carrier-protein] synthase family protein n=1 Tax=Bacillus velezensis TaxID=492670 RepID=UPI000CE00E5F|nr:beta-ketoacyl-[acyl-carrier-protein] synthase family protein [Bacillus velezensis]AVB08632.1 3-oxoacyl-ACP synthase [Bacillus velezensis]MCV2522141.1 beta-ketoacyl-[acyl-carrier-protein] synthase family protein [Bacillus velezensis]MEC0383905.1 beta-ketoacyl-[acyl-carrier-protein] synthase family protein [Bacillus velezensis]MEC0387988.1 beta-ketoacyl-[acyl-carrier-protein] synthase family protein [Bacillus velezensis]MEC3923652.1 beta-ketoacyl-[acyl-carrier-protein] synthase family protein